MAPIDANKVLLNMSIINGEYDKSRQPNLMIETKYTLINALAF
jgi:hypothetical protein